MSRISLPVHMDDFSTEEKAAAYAAKTKQETGWPAEVRHIGRHWEVWA